MQNMAPPKIVQVFLRLFLLFAVAPVGWAATSWWNPNWNYRIPITVEPANAEQPTRAVAVTINFSIAMKAARARGIFVSNTLRIVEVDAQGRSLDEEVPLQFEFAPDFHASRKAQGTVLFGLKGSTSGARRFHLYFETNEAPNLTELLTPYHLAEALPGSQLELAKRTADQWIVNIGQVETQPPRAASRPRIVTPENIVRTAPATAEMKATTLLWKSKPEHQFFPGYCTWYAAGKWKEFTGAPVTWSGDGGRWFDNAAEEGRSVSEDPKAAVKGAIMVWTRRGAAGHVAFVEAVTEDGVYISEMNARGRWVVSDAFLPFTNLDKGTKYKFRGYILPE
jgi:surface antigen